MRFSPGDDSVVDDSTVAYFSEVLDACSCWLHYVKREISQPDLWALAQEQLEILPPDPDSDADHYFTPNERRELKARLQQIKAFLVESQHLQAEDAARVEKKIDYLTERVDKLNRFDFTGVLTTTLLSIVIEEGLTSDAARQVWAFAAAQLAPVLGWIKLLGA